MKNETRKNETQQAARGGPRIEAYRLAGSAQPFPIHFHEYYVIGLIEGGERALSCKNQEYAIEKGHILLFNPGDAHACSQAGGALDYRGLNITEEAMLDLAGEAVGRRELPEFPRSAVLDREAACYLRALHELALPGPLGPGGEEYLLLLLSRLIRGYARPSAERAPGCREEVGKACEFMEQNYAGHISLDQICRRAGLGKSALLRAFVKEKGVTPYRYLESIRISRAGKLLKQGVPPAEAALRAGFFDQSHFTNRFTRFIGLPPGAYREIFKGK